MFPFSIIWMERCEWFAQANFPHFWMFLGHHKVQRTSRYHRPSDHSSSNKKYEYNDANERCDSNNCRNGRGAQGDPRACAATRESPAYMLEIMRSCAAFHLMKVTTHFVYKITIFLKLHGEQIITEIANMRVVVGDPSRSRKAACCWY